jgi:two-component system sensor histidine kinase VanS
MKLMKKRGIFFKMFIYTAIFLFFIVCVTVGLFSQQFLSFYNTIQTQQLYASYQDLHDQLAGKDKDEIITVARDFHSNNQSFAFYIRDNEENVLFSTPYMDTSDDMNFGSHRIRMSIGTEYTLFAINRTASQANYSGLIQKSLFALISMLAVGITGAFVFARQMTNPIKRLANDTKKMMLLEDVSCFPKRNDEIGSLACDVHSMYSKLKETISELEDEIILVREMEETQRYFFSAASHELKTPIAATSVLLEGMIENIGDYKDHPKYLRECLRLMSSQTKTISEILELVHLNDRKIVPKPEELTIHEVISSVLLNHQALADVNGQRIILNIPEDHSCLTDRKMLKKVLSNVILNAIQNTPSNGDIRIWSEPMADQYRVSVLNSGAYIEKEIISKLFDPFYRVDKARNQKDGRSGLGLTIVRKTLDAMGVEFELMQTKDGILFWLDLAAT